MILVNHMQNDYVCAILFLSDYVFFKAHITEYLDTAEILPAAKSLSSGW